MLYFARFPYCTQVKPPAQRPGVLSCCQILTAQKGQAVNRHPNRADKYRDKKRESRGRKINNRMTRKVLRDNRHRMEDWE